jgi:enamine deaminase RidA (YjgF/YER057c/UK114 family)
VTAGADGETAVSEPVRDGQPDGVPDAGPADDGVPAGAVDAASEASDAGDADDTSEGDDPTEAADPAEATDPAPDTRATDVADGVEVTDAADAIEPVAAPAVPLPPVPVAVPALEGPPSARLTQLGISLPTAPAPVAAYVPAVRSGDLVFTSGQLPFVAGALPLTGLVGDLAVDVTPVEATALARQCAVNALAAVAGVVDLDRVEQVVKVVVYVASAPGYGGQPQVANGASELLEQVFGEAGRHARSAVGVSALPLRSPVEVEVVVRVAAD